MADAIADLRGELATKGTFSADSVVPAPVPAESSGTSATLRNGHAFPPRFRLRLGTSLPKEPTQEQREQLRRLAPRADVKRMIEHLRAEVDETRTEVDELGVKLLELGAGVPASFQGMGGGMIGTPTGSARWGGRWAG